MATARKMWDEPGPAVEEAQERKGRRSRRQTGGGTAKSGAERAELEHLRNVLASIAAPMFVVDQDLMVTFISDAALQATGYTREEVVGKMTCAQVAQTPLCGTANCTIKNCMRSGDSITGETVMKRRDGTEVPITAACSALFDKDGQPYGGMEVIIDQTEQKATLKEVERLINAVTEGHLEERAEIGHATGDYKELREGINRMIDAFVGPFNVTAEYVDRISKGDIPEPITDEYKGDLDQEQSERLHWRAECAD